MRQLSEHYDVLVAGGGPGGIGAAYAAARAGARVLLVEKQGRLGGMMVNALVGPLMGNVRSKTVDDILTHIGGRTPDPHDLDVRLASLLEQNRADYLLHAQVVGVLKNGSRVTGLRCRREPQTRRLGTVSASWAFRRYSGQMLRAAVGSRS